MCIFLIKSRKNKLYSETDPRTGGGTARLGGTGGSPCSLEIPGGSMGVTVAMDCTLLPGGNIGWLPGRDAGILMATVGWVDFISAC